QGLVKSAALVTRLAHGIKHGMDWSTAREPLASLFYNRKHHIALPFVDAPGFKITLITLAMGYYAASFTPNIWSIIQSNVKPHAI
ncbi:hypothetical protein ONR49_25835, partial [Salmonella enterica subsp. enterica serovar Virginia]|nr:hypothetical protein [Salmonella enterica subsp. enterica serovar Virginia]